MSELNLNPDTDIGVEGIEHNHHEHDAQLITAPVTQSTTATASGDCESNRISNRTAFQIDISNRRRQHSHQSGRLKMN